MRDNDEILAEVFDSLIQQDGGRISSEVGDLFKIGLRLYNECPNANPFFLERLWTRLAREWAAQERRRNPLGAALKAAWHWLCLVPARRTAACAGVAVALMLAVLGLSPGLREGVEAGLSRIITYLPGALVIQQPQVAMQPTVESRDLGSFASLEEAARVAGFAPLIPSHLPAGYRYRQADVAQVNGRRVLLLRYSSASGDEFTDPWGGDDELVIQEIRLGNGADESALEMFVGPEGVEQVEVAGRPALWVVGIWSGKGRWVTGDTPALAVQDGGFLFVAWGSPSRAEIVRVMESLFE